MIHDREHKHRAGYFPYEPQLRPISWAENIWIVEGPEVQYRMGGLTIPCPTRMTVVKLADGCLWLHSPVIFSPELGRALAELGPVSALIAPNSYHYLHVKRWAAEYPAAQVFGTPDLAAKIGIDRFAALEKWPMGNWASDLEALLVDLGAFKEAVFFHNDSSTLIVTDLMQNFESSRIRSLPIRLLLKAGGATGPNGRPSIEIRLTAFRHGKNLRQAIQQMVAWQPGSIILSHGKCFRTNAVAELSHAFGSIL